MVFWRDRLKQTLDRLRQKTGLGPYRKFLMGLRCGQWSLTGYFQKSFFDTDPHSLNNPSRIFTSIPHTLKMILHSNNKCQPRQSQWEAICQWSSSPYIAEIKYHLTQLKNKSYPNDRNIYLIILILNDPDSPKIPTRTHLLPRRTKNTSNSREPLQSTPKSRNHQRVDTSKKSISW